MSDTEVSRETRNCSRDHLDPLLKKSSYLYSMNWKEAIQKYFPDIWQYLVIIFIMILAAIFIL